MHICMIICEIMTSFPQRNYFYNNENDALSYNSQPISTTSYSESSSNYGNHLDMYGRYESTGIGLETGSDLSGINVPSYNMLYGDSSHMTSDSGSLYDHAAKAADSGKDDTQSFKSNDNMLFRSNNASGYNNYGNSYDDWASNTDSGVGERHSSLGATKILPKVPSLKQNNSLLDGMYISNHHHHHQPNHQHQRYGASLPTTPPVAHKKSRMLPQPAAGAQKCGYSGYGGKNYGFHSQHNGYGASSSSCSDKGDFVAGVSVGAAVGVSVGVAGGLNGKCQTRVLPQPQPQTQLYRAAYSRHNLKSTEMQCKILADAAPIPPEITTTINTATASAISLTTIANAKQQDNMHGGINLNDNATINDYKNYAATSLYSSPAFVNTASMPRPYTALAERDYGADDYSYTYNSAESLSTYSEPTTKVAQSNQQQMMQQERKSSIIMAMTTASVIASGETRIASKTQSKDKRDYRSASFEYDCTGVAAPKNDLFDPATTTDDFFYNPALLEAATSTAAIEEKAIYTGGSSIRKLPKCLPTSSVASNSSNNGSNITSYISSINSNTYHNNNNNNNSRTSNTSSSISSRGNNSTKQLPKLSQSKLLTNIAAITATTDDKAEWETPPTATYGNEDTFGMCSTYTNRTLYDTTTTATTTTATTTTRATLSPPLLDTYVPAYQPQQQRASLFFPPYATDTAAYYSKEATTDSYENVASTLVETSRDNSNYRNTDIDSAVVTKSFSKAEADTSILSSSTTAETTTISSRATATSSTLDYSDYLKSYTLPTFSAYISNIGKSNDLENLVLKSSSSQPSAETLITLETSTTSPSLSATTTTATAPTSSYASTAYDSDSYSLFLAGITTASLFSPTTTSTTSVDIVGTSFDIAQQQLFMCDSLSERKIAKTLSFTSKTSPPSTSSTSSPITRFDATEVWTTTVNVTTTTPTISSNTIMLKPALDETSSLLPSLSYPLGVMTTSTIAKETTETAPITTTTTTSVFCYDAGLFTTTFSSDTLPTISSFAASNVATTLPSTTKAESSIDSNAELSYNEYMKQFSLDSYTTSPVMFDGISTPAAAITEDNYAQYTSDYTLTFPSVTPLKLGSSEIAVTLNEISKTTTAATTATTIADLNLADYTSSYMLPYMTTTTTPTENALEVSVSTPATVTTAVFDDNFYDSFTVDLKALTATTVEATTVKPHEDSYYTFSDALQANETTTTSYRNTTSTPQIIASTTSIPIGTQGGYHQPAKTTAAVTTKPTSTTATTVGKASSMFGGLSKGIMGGLDGVLSGVSADASKQQQPQQTKKAFGFGLASKLVPNVGGLLQSAATLKTQQSQQVQPHQPVINETTSASNGFSILHQEQQKYAQSMLLMTTIAGVCEWNDVTGSMMSSNSQPLYTTDKSRAVVYDTNSSIYYNHENNLVSSPTVTEPMYDEEDYNDPLQHDATQYASATKIVDYSTDYKYGYDEYGYSESDYIATGDIMEKSNSYGSCSNYDKAKQNNQASLTATAASATAIKTASITTMPAATSTSSTSIGMPTSLLSSLANTAAPAPATKTTASSRGGGMFGSFLDKAAAAVQSATQAVNQGASIATAVVQKVPTVAAAASDVTKANTVASDGEIFYDQAQLAYTTVNNSNEDYENCNMLTTSEAATMQAQINNRNNNYGNNYYAGESDQMLLPTVPPAGSTGKKLPTINGKSGFLMKQQPTEIFDDEDDDIEDDDDIIDDYVGEAEPNYRMDSEQDDYYMDHQQTTPLSRGSSQELAVAMANTNGYFEHTNGGYDYREDYFNEEDEYKYLEKEQKAQEALLLQQQHTQSLLHQHQKQPPLEYIEESRDDYIDDNYPSEDSGNYLDESSSGSGGGGCSAVGRAVGFNQKILKDEFIGGAQPVLATSTAAASAHQQIRKQDSIILEEDVDEDELICSTNSIGGRPTGSRKSSDITLEEDQMTELPQIMQKKRKPVLMRGETEEVVSGHMQQMIRKPEVTAKQRWHWAYNKIIMQLNVSIRFVII